VSGSDRLRVLFLCTGNSARSQMAEAILRHLSGGRVDVRSAGSEPRPEIHPLAGETVRRLLGREMTDQYPKSVNDLLSDPVDWVITVCDRAAEACPTLPGAPRVVRWSLPDPAEGTRSEEEARRAFEDTARELMRRIRLWLSLPEIVERLGAGAASRP